MSITVAALASQVQVNIPFPYLLRGYLERFLELGLNPEIGLDAYSLSRYPPRVWATWSMSLKRFRWLSNPTSRRANDG